MKTLGCVAALVGLTIGFASAGPVAVSGDGSSMCNIQCGPQRFKYTPGKSYLYKYSTKTETALEQSSDEKSTIYLDADVSLHAIDSCRFALKVESVKLDEEISGGGRRASKGTQELSEFLTKTPLIFNYEDGVVTRLCPAQHESKSALNIKRGILSMIQNKMRNYAEAEIQMEEDVNGECPAVYTAEEQWGGLIKILKEKPLQACKGFKEQNVVSVIALPQQMAQSSSMINATQECRQTIKNSILDSVECNERHVVKPFSRQEKGAATEIHQSLRFQRAGDAQVNALHYTEGEEETLRFDPTPDTELLDSQAEPHARSIIQRLGNEKSTDIKATNDDFVQLLSTFRKMRYETLKKMVLENKSNQWIFDALADTLTRDAMKLMAELVKTRVVPTDVAEGWLVKVALTTGVDIPRIQMLLPLLDMEEFTVGAHLAVSSVARTYLEENPSTIPEEINRLLRRLYSQVKPGTPGKLLIASIKAIGNIGIATGQEGKLLEVTSRQDTETRLAAIEAFHRFPCDTVKRDSLMRIFTDGSETIEVRIAAYLNSIRCPTKDMITTVRDTLLKEPKGSPLASFVFTHVKNLEKRSSFTEDVSPVTSNESLKSLEIDSNSFSKNYYYEMFLSPIDMGFEVDAGSIMTDKNYNFMLNTTFDVFGYKANVFDSKVRVQRDLSQTNFNLRLFGNEVLYGSEGRKSNSDIDAFLKSVMSRNGWKFSRSMMLIDSEMILATGNGFPLVVNVNGTSTLDVDLKAMPLQGQQGSKYVAEVRSAPSMAMQFGISMMTQAPQTKSGIKMVVTSSSQWDLNGRVNIDLTGSSMLRNIQIEAPRDRSDLIDIRSDVYLVGSNSQHEIKAVGSQQKHSEMCTGNTVHVLAGHKACVEATYPAAMGEDSPFFLLRGPSHLNVRWEKTDKSLKMFHIQSSFEHGQRDLLELAFEMDTPGSQVDRKFKGRVYRDLRTRKFGLDLISPLKSLNLEGMYQETPTDKKTELLVKVDGKTEMSVLAAMQVANGRATVMSPTLEVTMRDRRIVLIKSQIASHGSQKYNGDMEIQSIWNEKPIKMSGEYSVVNDDRRLTLGVNSAWLQYNMQSSLSQRESRQWEMDAAGDYVYNQGSKHTFNVGGKFWDDSESVSVELRLKRNDKTFVSTKAKLDKKLPPNVDMAVELLEGRFKGTLVLESEESRADLTAMAVVDNKKYATQIKWQRQPSLTSFSGKFELPNNVERHLSLQYDLASPVKRVVFDSDLIGKPYSARVSYMPAEKLHKVSASMKMDKESASVAAMLSTDSVYQTSLNVVHNGAKLLSTSFGVNMDSSKPDIKLFLQLREQPLVDLATDTRVGPQSVNFGLKMRAPIEVTANAALRKSGSVADTLGLKADIEVSSPDRWINLAVNSNAEISLWQRSSSKLNVQTSVRCPGGTSEFVFNNLLDASSWSLDWRFHGPGQAKQHVQSTGTYSLELPKLHLRGGLDMNVRAFGRHVVVDGLALDTELSVHEEQMAFKTEVLSSAGASIFNVAGKLGNTETNKLASLDMNIRGKSYLVMLELDGRDLRTGFRTTLEGKCHDKTISGTGDLRWDGQHILFNMDFQSSFEEFAKTKLLFQSQAFSDDTTLINSEYALGQHSATAEVIVDSSSLQANIRTSIRDWQNLKAQARWELKPKMIVVVDFSSAKYPNNVVEFEMQNQNGVTAKLRVSAPAAYRGNFLEGSLKYTNGGDGVLDLLHMGQQKAKLLFTVKNEGVFKNVATELFYNLNGVSDRWNLEVGVEGNAKELYDAKLSLRKNSKLILDVNYLGSLNTQGGIMFQNRWEMRTSLPGVPQNAYLNNQLTITSDSVKTLHELGTSSKDIQYSLDVSGHLINNRDMLAFDGKLDGKWGRLLKGSVSAEMKTDMKNSVQLSSRVESDRSLICSTKWSLARRDRLVEFEAKWEAPKMKRETSLKMRSGIEEPESFIFETTLDRDQDVEKSSEISVRLPLQTRIIDSHMRIKMPRELGNQALRASLMARRSMVSVSGGVSMDQGRRSYSGEVSSDWSQDFTVNGHLKENTNDIVKATLKASSSRPGTYELTAGAMHNELSFDGKVRGEWTEKNGEIVMEAQSSHWDRKHLLRGFYSLDSKTGSLKVDIAKLKVTIDSMMSGSYKLRGDANYDGRAIADFALNYDSRSKQGDLEATVTGKRMTSNFIARMNNGELKLELPSGKSSLNWNLDRQNKMSVNGIWTFHSENWRVEAFFDPRNVREAEAKIFYKEQRIGTLYAMCKSDQASLKLDLNWAGEKHSTELGYTKRDGLFKGVFKLNCPWLFVDPIDAEFGLDYGTTKVVLNSLVKVGSSIHSVMADGHIQGEHITGTIKTRCSYYGDMNGHFEGTINKDGFDVKWTSDKLKQPVHIDGKKTSEFIGLRIKSEAYEADTVIYTGKKYGIELRLKNTELYEFYAVAENHKSLKMIVQTPGIPKIGLTLMEIAPNSYGVEVDVLGRRVVQAKWTGTTYNMDAGTFNGNVDFGTTIGKHNVMVSYSFVKIPSLKIEIDGHVVLDGHFERGNHSMLGKWTMNLAQLGDVTVEVRHQLNNEQLQSALKISHNGKNIGYELRLHEEVFGSMLRIDTPRRSVSMELDRKQAEGEIAGRIAWDHGRDPQKSVELLIFPERSNDRQSNRKQHRLTVSIPKLGEKLMVRVTETDEGHQIQALDGQLSMNAPRLSLMYSRKGKLMMTLGNLIMRAEMSPKKSELVVKRMTAQEDDINVGYNVEGNTLSARLHWTPRLPNNFESSARSMLGELQKGTGNKQDKQLRRISEFFVSEIESIRSDLRAMMSELRRLYDQNTWNVKSAFESLVQTGGRVSEYVDYVTEQIEDMIRDLKRVLTRYSQRLGVASAVINAIHQEITEDIVDSFVQWLARVENSISNEHLKSIVQRFVRFVKEDYQMIVNALDYAVDEYICEFSTEQTQLHNKRCGLAYQLNSQHEQHGLTMRLPVAVMQS